MKNGSLGSLKVEKRESWSWVWLIAIVARWPPLWPRAVANTSRTTKKGETLNSFQHSFYKPKCWYWIVKPTTVPHPPFPHRTWASADWVLFPLPPGLVITDQGVTTGQTAPTRGGWGTAFHRAADDILLLQSFFTIPGQRRPLLGPSPG